MATREKSPAGPQPRPMLQAAGALLVMATAMGMARAVATPRSAASSTSPRHSIRPTSQPASDRGGNARGRAAHTPEQIPVRGWKDIAWRVYGSIQEDRILLIAAGVTFYTLLAIFPATAALVTLYGLFTDPSTISEHVRLASGFLPEGAVGFISEQAARIAQQRQGTLSLAFIGSLALALWGANAGTKSVFEALNVIYKEDEKRSFFRLTLYSLTFTLGGLAIALLSIGAVVAVPMLGFSGKTFAWLLSLMRWPMLYGVILFALACLYRYGPSRARAQWRWVTWGSAIAGGIWILASLLLSWYIANFGNFNVTYGSLGAVVGFLMWTWMSMIIVMLGGEINAEMEHQTAKDTTEQPGKPMGARGARMADEVGRAASP